MRPQRVGWMMLALIVWLAACQSSTGTVSPTEAQNDVPQTTTDRTGIAIVDSIIEAVLSNDADTLRELIRFTTTGCTHAEGLGGPPKCEDDQSEGTPVEVFPILGPEGVFIRSENIDSIIPAGQQSLYAVYRVAADAFEADFWPAGEYGIVFAGQGSAEAITLLVDESGIVRMVFSDAPENLVRNEVGEFIIPPRD